MNRYLWCEDSKSGYQFWQAIFRVILPDMKVETKQSNSGLRKAVSRIVPDENEYYIMMDAAIDNPDVLRETKYLSEKAKGKDNVHIVTIHSFELTLLSFEDLERWVFAEKDELKDQRQRLLNARAMLIESITSTAREASGLTAFKEAFDDYEVKNTEQIASKLLREITRNTGFETDKSSLGECFINSCCEWKERGSDDICGLDDHRIDANEKARLLVERSILKQAFERAGL